MYHLLFVLGLEVKYVLVAESIVHCVQCSRTPGRQRRTDSSIQLAGKMQSTFGSFIHTQELGTSCGSGPILASGDTAVNMPDEQVFPGAPVFYRKPCPLTQKRAVWGRGYPNEVAGEMSVSRVAVPQA